MAKKTPKPEAHERDHTPERSSLMKKYKHYDSIYGSFIKNSQANKNRPAVKNDESADKKD